MYSNDDNDNSNSNNHNNNKEKMMGKLIPTASKSAPSDVQLQIPNEGNNLRRQVEARLFSLQHRLILHREWQRCNNRHWFDFLIEKDVILPVAYVYNNEYRRLALLEADDGAVYYISVWIFPPYPWEIEFPRRYDLRQITTLVLQSYNQ